MLTLAERIKLQTNPTAKKLLQLMEEKQTNLAVAADVTSCDELLFLAERVADTICLLKTHVDILKDFTFDAILELRKIADKKGFLLFEDRKFADIGNTVLQQYQGGIYKIAEWADIINAHIVPGYGIIEGLQKVGLTKGKALLLLAEMSSKGTLAEGSYTQKAVALAESYSDFSIGFISMGKIAKDPKFIHMTPGIQMHDSADPFGQQYRTPSSAISRGSDIIIVGRGIYGQNNPREAALAYQKEGWKTYASLL